MTRIELLKEEVNRYLRILKAQYQPEKILLFGSLASGNVKKWSDIDLILVKDTRKSFFDRLKEIYLLLKPKAGLDVLVYTPREYEEIKKRPFFRQEIIGKSKLLYEKNNIWFSCSGRS